MSNLCCLVNPVWECHSCHAKVCSSHAWDINLENRRMCRVTMGGSMTIHTTLCRDCIKKQMFKIALWNR